MTLSEDLIHYPPFTVILLNSKLNEELLGHHVVQSKYG